ncbi:hypothetical protein [Halomonas korlensis]|uniref:hypothetical protein n=1 Tax=Halomonas korlensis TaxID=463301 RepID=UPI0011145A36|nr:hypothetical protein [Halomonas korlensis]
MLGSVRAKPTSGNAQADLKAHHLTWKNGAESLHERSVTQQGVLEMMSREFLKRIGVVGVILGLAASPLAFADDSAKKEGKEGNYSKADKTTMEDSNATGGAGEEAQQGDSDWKEQQGQEGSAPEGENDNGAAVTSDPNVAGGAGIEGKQGTQSGDEPEPEEEAGTQTQ